MGEAAQKSRRIYRIDASLLTKEPEGMHTRYSHNIVLGGEMQITRNSFGVE